MLYWAQSAQAAQQVHLEWWWFLPPGLAVGLFGTGLALLNFGIDEFVNPRLRSGTGGVSGRRARRAGLSRRPAWPSRCSARPWRCSTSASTSSSIRG